MLSVSLLLLLVGLSDAQMRCQYPPTYDATVLKVIEFRDGSGIPYFRHMTFDDSKYYIYVGAMDYVYKLNTNDISRGWLRSSELPARQDDKSLCDAKHPSSKDMDCRNHIRAIIPDGNQLLICGTGAYFPLKLTLDSSSLTPSSTYPPSTRNSGMMVCPFSPSDSYTTLFLKNGDNKQLYAGTILRTYQTDYAIARPQMNNTLVNIRTYSSNAFWLNDVEFIQTFDSGSYIYFFFNEVGLELSSCKQGTRVATVARICKSDLGGSADILPSVWTTFVKARLNCSLNGQDMYTQLRDIQFFDGRYYGLFWKELGYANGSAICSFKQGDIDQVFEGSFQEYDTNEKWVEIPVSKVPTMTSAGQTIRPGQCYPEGTELSSDVQYFIKSHPLMHSSIQSWPTVALHHFNNVFYEKLAMHPYYYLQNYFLIYYLPSQGEIHKYVTDYFNNSAKTVAKWKIYDASAKIWQLLLYNDQLYVSTDESVQQVPVKQCVYPKCDLCVQDPHCGWDPSSRSCQPFDPNAGLRQTVYGDPMDVCTCQSDKQMSRYTFSGPGEFVLLPCSDTLCCPLHGTSWTFNSQPISWQDNKYLMTSNGSLIVKNITGLDVGIYRCYSKNVLFDEHSIVFTGYSDKCKFVPAIDTDVIKDTMDDFYTTWWNDLNEYGDEYNHWTDNKNVLTSAGEACPSRDLPQCSSSP